MTPPVTPTLSRSAQRPGIEVRFSTQDLPTRANAWLNLEAMSGEQQHARFAETEQGHEGGRTAPAIPFSRPATPTPAHDQLALVGLGAMGQRMAFNLAKHLHETHQPPLVVYNRSAPGVDAFKVLADEAQVPYKIVRDLQEIGRTCDIIITSLGSDEAVLEVFKELFAGEESKSNKGDGIVPGGRGSTTIFVDTSTIYPHTAGQIERQAAARESCHFLSCPVFGAPDAAERADLVLAISGDYFAKKHVAHALVPAIGRKIMDLGSNVERAMSFKLVGNSLVLGMLELLAESMTLADQTGVGSETLLELIKEIHGSPSMVRYGTRIQKNDFHGEGGFVIGGGLKDASHIRKLAEEHNVPMPIIDVAHQHLISARAHGGDKLDWSALVGGERISAGLQPFAGKVRLERED